MFILLLISFLFFPNLIFAVDATSSAVTPTATPSATITPTLNPDDGVFLNEFMPYLSLSEEWIEIYNKNDFSVVIDGWKIEDILAQVGLTINNITIEARSYLVLNLTKGILNNSGSDKIILRNHNNAIVDSHHYEDGYYSLNKSWSKVDGNWCQADISKGQINNDCFIFPTIPPTLTSTPIPTPTNTPAPTPTPDLNRYQAPTGPTPSVIMAPTSKENTPTPISSPTLTPSSEGMVLGIDDNQPPKKNFLPMIFIVLGGILLITPVIITKIKK